jgi:hypothetical protein
MMAKYYTKILKISIGYQLITLKYTNQQILPFNSCKYKLFPLYLPLGRTKFPTRSLCPGTTARQLRPELKRIDYEKVSQDLILFLLTLRGAPCEGRSSIFYSGARSGVKVAKRNFKSGPGPRIKKGRKDVFPEEMINFAG